LQSIDRYAEATGSTRSAVLTEGGALLMRVRPSSKVNASRLTGTSSGAAGVPAHKVAGVTGPEKKASGHAMRESPTRPYVTSPAKGAKTKPTSLVSRHPSGRKK
jgi:hypothetical protein